MNKTSYNSFFIGLPLKFLVSVLFFSLLIYNNNCYCQSKKKISVVVIDAGHGGKDPGAQGNKVNEKDVALGIALKLGGLIQKNIPDVKVIYTRETDVFIELFQRAEIANKNQADLFISIHVNSNPSSAPDGVETYFMGETKAKDNLEVAKKENDVILIEDNYSSKYEGYDPKSAESVIIFSLFQKTYQAQSFNFASYVQNQFKEHAQRIDRGIKQAGFLVLWKTVMPSVLVETGFISNPEEARFLKSEHGQDVLATSIYRAFRKYKSDIESRSMFVSNNHGHKDSVTGSRSHKAEEAPEKPETSDSDSSSVKPVEFFVQIASSKKSIPLKKGSFKGLEHVEELKINDSYKYVVGRKTSYREVYEYSKIVKNYFPDAFIIALRNGKIIPVREAIKEIKD
jgi:N-acetylmuramoyl-L-alanine amidase